METTTREGRLSPRARRALPLIAASVLVATWASVAYLQPSLLRLPQPAHPAKAAGPATLSNNYAATYAFLTPSLGWALVTETTSLTPRFSVFRTTDAAKNWKRQFVRQLNVISFGTFLLRFFDPSHGFIAVGDPTEIYRTSDGGTHWALLKTPSYLFSSFVAADAQHGWLLGWTGPPDQMIPDLFSTSDGGDTWTALPRALPRAGGQFGYRSANLIFRSPREGWFGANAAEPIVYSSVDGGASWLLHKIPNSLDPNLCPGGKPLPPGTQAQLMTYAELLPGHGVVVITNDYCGHVEGHTSLDGGQTWQALATLPGTIGWWSFAYQDSSHWWTMQSGTLWKSSDAGQSWKLVSKQNNNWDGVLHVIDAMHAWAELFSNAPGSSGWGGLAVTSDGGMHWTQVSAPKPV
jgi:photosystem II stability/assembly factor-like uncharacterized protein